MTSLFNIGDKVTYLNSKTIYVVRQTKGNFITELKEVRNGTPYKGMWAFKDFNLVAPPKPYEAIIRKIKYLDQKFENRHAPQEGPSYDF